MKTKTLYIGVVIFTLLSFRTDAQQSMVYSQYIFNGLLINPAYAGSHVQFSATISYRNQWVNFEGSPQTAAFRRPAAARRTTADRAEVDRILDKISATGLHSLSEREKRILREASDT